MEKIAVIKLGTSLLTTDNGTIKISFLGDLCEDIAVVKKADWKIIIVSSGAMASGKGCLKDDHHSICERSLFSVVGQPILMNYYSEFLKIHGIKTAQCLLTWNNFENQNEKVILERNLLKILENDIIPIINENDLIAEEELRSGDNDTLAAKVAALLQADKLMILSDVDGLYTDNPQQNPDAKKIEDVYKINDKIFSYVGEKKSENSLGGMKSKLRAAEIAGQNGVETSIFKGVLGGHNIIKILIEDKKVGTKFYPANKIV
jgi:glutamate 5-kinase